MAVYQITSQCKSQSQPLPISNLPEKRDGLAEILDCLDFNVEVRLKRRKDIESPGTQFYTLACFG